MSRIVRVELKNFLCFKGEQAVDLPAGPVAIVATYAGNERRSNQGGKTSFLQVVRWACWGIHRKRIDDRIIYTGQDEVSASLRFSDGVALGRSRPRGGLTKVWFSQEASTVYGEDAEDAIADYLGLTYRDAKATVLFEQGDTEALVGKQSSERRETLAAWLELDLWDRLGKRARTDAAAAQQAVSLVRMALDGAAPTDREATVIATDIARAETDAATALDAERAAYAELKRAHSATAARAAAGRLEAGAAEAKALREKIRALPVVDRAADEQLERELSESRSRLTIAQRAEDVARGNARGTFDGVCPVTRRACSVADEVRADRTATEAAYRIAAEDRAVLDREHREVASREEVRRSDRQERERLTTTFNAKAAEVRRLREEAVSSEDLDDAPSTVEAERQHVEALARARRAEQELSALRAEAARAEVSARRRRDHAVALASAERDARRAALVLRALSPSGIQARVASAAMLSLEERANALLVGTGLSFSLSWERELADLAPTCVECGHVYKGKRDKSCPSCAAVRGAKKSDELDVLVRDDSGEEEDAREKSGGARALIASAIRLAGGAMLRERRSSTVAWALVDEPFGALDQENREGLARSFSSMLGSVGLEQALIVSHDAALLAALPHTIRIVRDGSVSRLEVG